MTTPNELRFLHFMTHKETAKYKYCAPEMAMFDAAPDRFIPGSQSVYPSSSYALSLSLLQRWNDLDLCLPSTPYRSFARSWQLMNGHE